MYEEMSLSNAFPNMNLKRAILPVTVIFFCHFVTLKPCESLAFKLLEILQDFFQ